MITLSPKHGVNPSIPICFFCGKTKNEIVFLGKLKGDVEAPKEVLLNYEPCDKCKEHFDKGVTLIEVSTTPNFSDQPAISEQEGNKLYPTAKWCVLKEEATKRIFGEEQTKKVMLVEIGILDRLMGGTQNDEEESSNVQNDQD